MENNEGAQGETTPPETTTVPPQEVESIDVMEGANKETRNEDGNTLDTVEQDTSQTIEQTEKQVHDIKSDNTSKGADDECPNIKESVEVPNDTDDDKVQACRDENEGANTTKDSGNGDNSTSEAGEKSKRDTPVCSNIEADNDETSREAVAPNHSESGEADVTAESDEKPSIVCPENTLPPEPPAEPYSSRDSTPEVKIRSPELPQVLEEEQPEPPPARPQSINVIHRSAHQPSRAAAAIKTSLSLNQMAIAASAQNKLPISRVQGIVERVGRHTESSAQKRGGWYKSESTYVDVNSYSWKNLALYKDYQQHMWTGDGAIRSGCKK